MSYFSDEEYFEKYKRLDREYIKISYIILNSLEMFAAAPESLLKNNFSAFAVSDTHHDFDSDCDLLKSEMRRGILPELNCKQLKELLRCQRYHWEVDLIAFEDAKRGLIEKRAYAEINRRLVEHPLWEKMAKQSRKTLKLLRRSAANP